AFAILCAGAFPPFTSARPVLLPERCLAAIVDATFDGGRLGVIVPIKQQQASSATRWSRVDPGVVVTVASPYDDSSRLIAAAEELRRAGVSLVVMECQGFTGAMKQVVRDVTGAPALLPTSVLARFLAELACAARLESGQPLRPARQRRKLLREPPVGVDRDRPVRRVEQGVVEQERLVHDRHGAAQVLQRAWKARDEPALRHVVASLRDTLPHAPEGISRR